MNIWHITVELSYILFLEDVPSICKKYFSTDTQKSLNVFFLLSIDPGRPSDLISKFLRGPIIVLKVTGDLLMCMPCKI